MKGESYKKKVASNVKYHKEIMEDQKRPLWLAIEEVTVVFQAFQFQQNGGSSRQIGTVLGQVSGRKLIQR